VAPTPGSEVRVAEDRTTPVEEVQRLYAEAETQLAKAMEQLVARDSFASLLVRSTENVMALAQIANGALDLVVRNLRIAGRNDVTNLARQIGRTEDKLERVLQEVERLQEQVAALQAAPGNGANGAPKPAPRASRRAGAS
jgi:hypothetical protein